MDNLAEAQALVGRVELYGVTRAQVHATLALVERLERVAVALEKLGAVVIKEGYDGNSYIQTHEVDY